jgi:hypothetical protein
MGSIALTVEQRSTVERLAAPVSPFLRPKYLQLVMDKLADAELDDGLVARVAAAARA